MNRGNAVCPTPGCPEITPGGPCPKHRSNHQRQSSRIRRATTGPQPYDTEAWKTTRARYKRKHPRCAQCPAATAHVDHICPRRILIAAGIHNPDADHWLQPLCERCHNRKTQLVDVPFLRRWHAGEDPATLADLALMVG